MQVARNAAPLGLDGPRPQTAQQKDILKRRPDMAHDLLEPAQISGARIGAAVRARVREQNAPRRPPARIRSSRPSASARRTPARAIRAEAGTFRNALPGSAVPSEAFPCRYSCNSSTSRLPASRSEKSRNGIAKVPRDPLGSRIRRRTFQTKSRSSSSSRIARHACSHSKPCANSPNDCRIDSVSPRSNRSGPVTLSRNCCRARCSRSRAPENPCPARKQASLDRSPASATRYASERGPPRATRTMIPAVAATTSASMRLLFPRVASAKTANRKRNQKAETEGVR